MLIVGEEFGVEAGLDVGTGVAAGVGLAVGLGVEVGVGVGVGIGEGVGAVRVKDQIPLQSLHVPEVSLTLTLQYQLPKERLGV